MKLHGLAAAVLLGSSALALAGCAGMGGGYDQPSAAQSSRAQADRQAIAHVQSELQQLGYYAGSVDGAWGPESRTALANFQQAKGLPPTGQPDQMSLSALSNAAANGAPAATASTAPSSTTTTTTTASTDSTRIPSISEVQQELQQLGYYHGQVDGRWGPGTRTAMAGFQRAQSLPVTGHGDMRSMNRLASVAQSSASGSSDLSAGATTPMGTSGGGNPPATP